MQAIEIKNRILNGLPMTGPNWFLMRYTVKAAKVAPKGA